MGFNVQSARMAMSLTPSPPSVSSSETSYLKNQSILILMLQMQN